MQAIDVHDLPEPIAEAIDSMVQALRTQRSQRTGSNIPPRWETASEVEWIGDGLLTAHSTADMADTDDSGSGTVVTLSHPVMPRKIAGNFQAYYYGVGCNSPTRI